MNARLPLRFRAGFTLVEIAVAIGIISVCLVGLLAVMSAASSTSRDSDRDTVIVSMSSQILDDLRSLPFDLIGFATPRTHLTDATIAVLEASKNPPQPSVYYFTMDGSQVTATGEITPPLALYKCTVTKTPDLVTRSLADPTIKDPPRAVNLLQLELLFEWPAAIADLPKDPSKPERRPSRKSIYASIARY